MQSQASQLQLAQSQVRQLQQHEQSHPLQLQLLQHVEPQPALGWLLALHLTHSSAVARFGVVTGEIHAPLGRLGSNASGVKCRCTAATGCAEGSSTAFGVHEMATTASSAGSMMMRERGRVLFWRDSPFVFVRWLMKHNCVRSLPSY